MTFSDLTDFPKMKRLIMPKSIIFSYFHHLNKQLQLTSSYGSTVSFKTDANHNKYFIYELPCRSGLKFTDESSKITYTIQSQHLSFYENVDHQHPCKSIYHFTASLIDSNQQEHTLHVYFNEKDELTIQAQIATTRVSDDLLNTFETYAYDISHPHICKIRRLRQEKIKELLNDYSSKQLMLCHLYKTIKSNKHNYLTCIDSIIDLISLLIEIEPMNKFKALLKTYIHTKVNIQSIETTTTEADHPPKPIQPKPAANAKSTPKLNANPNSNLGKEKGGMANNRSRFDQLESMFVKSKQLLTAYQCAKAENDANKLNLLLQLQTEVAQLNRFILIESLEPNQTYGHQFQEINEMLAKEANDLIIDLMKTGQSTKLSLFEEFIDNYPSEIIDYALSAGNANLLDYILSIRLIDLNLYTLESEAQFYLPMRYCYEILYATDPNAAVKCASVLLKYNASMLILSSHELPIAYELLQNTAHPMHNLLVTHPQKPLENPNFFKRMLGKLQHFKSTNPSVESRCIDESITRFNEKIVELKPTLHEPRKGERLSKSNLKNSIPDSKRALIARLGVLTAEMQNVKTLLDKVTQQRKSLEQQGATVTTHGLFAKTQDKASAAGPDVDGQELQSRVRV